MKQLNTATLDQARVHRRSASLRGYNMAAVTKAPKAPRPTTKARAKARAKASAKNKFVPIEPLPMRELQVAPAVDGKVPHGASILIVQEPWISLILSGHKKYEIRGSTCKISEGVSSLLSQAAVARLSGQWRLSRRMALSTWCLGNRWLRGTAWQEKSCPMVLRRMHGSWHRRFASARRCLTRTSKAAWFGRRLEHSRRSAEAAIACA
jgi:sRNA-binding protein